MKYEVKVKGKMSTVKKAHLQQILDQQKPWYLKAFPHTWVDTTIITNIRQYISSIKSETLNNKQLRELQLLLQEATKEEQAESRFKALCDMVHTSLAKYSFQSQLLKFLCTENYYSSRMHDLCASMQELMPNDITPLLKKYAETGGALLYCGLSLYYFNPYFLLAKIGESSLPFVAQQYNKLSNNNKILVSWGIDWTMQLGISLSNTMQQLIVNYTVADLFQSYSEKLFNCFKENKYAKQYPYTFISINNLFNDLGYSLGLQTGNYFYKFSQTTIFFHQENNKENTSENTKKNSWKNAEENTSKKTDENAEQSSQSKKEKLQFTPVILITDQKKALNSCSDSQYQSKICDDISQKILHTDLKKPCKENNDIIRKHILFWHPDRKNENYDSQTRQEQIIQINLAAKYWKNTHGC